MVGGGETVFFKTMNPVSEICRCYTLEQASDANILLRFLARNVCGWNTKVLLHRFCPSWIMSRVEGCYSFASIFSITPLLSFVGAFLDGWSDRDIAVPLLCSCLSSGSLQFFCFSVPCWSSSVLLCRNMQPNNQR